MTNDRDARHDQPCGTPAEAAANIPSSPEEDGVDLLDLLLVFVRHWRLIVGMTFLFAVGGLAYALLATPIYRAEARLVPPTGGGSSGAMAMLAQLGGAADFAAGALGVKTPADLLVGLVKSRTVVDRIIAEFSLLEQYQQEKMTTCRTAVLDILSVTADMKSGIITLAYEDKSPDQAAAIANAFVRGLQDLLKGLAVTQASQQRLFLEEQLKKAQLDLLQAENNLQAYQQTTGILNVDAQMA
ncbi:MAG TPA: Wzz/FepE/Etk N-terminal domain-containing protein, partial [Synergistaceae bacterium]|nr:Wzz/FepE/Etk N-terminal domain-containing protein [Synergistaceae bacterium]